MKVLLLVLDGLDLDTVKRLSCIQLLQNQYCLTDVPIDNVLKVPSSPTVWASFLAGKLVERHFGNKKLPSCPSSIYELHDLIVELST